MKVFFIHKTPSIFKSKVDIHFFLGGGGLLFSSIDSFKHKAKQFHTKYSP